ncbi:hypothetical protein MAR_033956, partial [Mya arenaria]
MGTKPLKASPRLKQCRITPQHSMDQQLYPVWATWNEKNYDLRLGDVELKTSSSGLKYLALNERQTKTRTGSNITDVRDVTPKIFSIPEDIERCPVHAYKLYAVQRPIDFCTSDDPFYIAPRTSSQSHGHDHEN